MSKENARSRKADVKWIKTNLRCLFNCLTTPRHAYQFYGTRFDECATLGNTYYVRQIYKTTPYVSRNIRILFLHSLKSVNFNRTSFNPLFISRVLLLNQRKESAIYLIFCFFLVSSSRKTKHKLKLKQLTAKLG